MAGPKVLRDALATLVVAGASCFAAAATLGAQSRPAPAGAPRMDGLRLGVGLISQRVRSENVLAFDGEAARGTALTVSWGIHPRVALVTSWSSAAADFSGETYDVSHTDAVLQYQVGRSRLVFPYLEAGLSRVVWAETWDAPNHYEFIEWMPVLGAGLRLPLANGVSLAAGARLSRGNLRHERADGGVRPLTAISAEAVRWIAGAEWHARPGVRPVLLGRGPQRLTTRGLGLTLGTTHAESWAPSFHWMGSGASFGATWGLADRLAVVARYSRSRPRRFDGDMDLRHRDVALRLALRGTLHAIRPYAELGGSTVEQRYRLFGTLFRDRGTMPFFGGGFLYAIQRDLDLDLGAAITQGRMNDVAIGPRSHYRTLRVRAGLEYRPPR